jgi:D-alanyl-D-alanine carboxypeptidase
MANALRVGTALTALGLIGGLTACASPGAKTATRASIFGDKVDHSNIGLATRAQAAIEKGDINSAISLAERAVGNTPNDAGFRMLLGNAYFAGGRFASAEAAYKDSLQLLGTQPQVVLKLALVTIAQGKHGQAVELLDSSRPMLDPADYGLALALAGRPDSAVLVLDAAAREVGADARVRQNLALAHALKGDWEMAKTVASQDLAADQLDARVQQWMTFAKPATVADQVASLTGITPAASDPGQPVRLALNKSNVRMADAAPAPSQPIVEDVPVTEVAQVADAPVAMAEPAPAAEVAPVEVAAAAVVPGAAPAPIVEAQMAVLDTLAPTVEAAPAPALSPRAASFEAPRKAAVRKFGGQGAVVQLGAFASRGNVNAAWSKYAAKFPSLRGYTPATARFDSANGTVYRLSVGGFGSSREAQNFCSALKGKGSACFVRTAAGDAPVRIALR